jgi:hypothetical protein
MKQIALTFAALCAAGALCYAGPEQYSGKEMKQVAPTPCPEWYADNEWNVGLWGTYAFGGDNGHSIDDSDLDFIDGETVHFNNYVGDEAWGGGIDLKYFFKRYFGIGIEAYGLATDDNNHVSESLRDDGIDPDDGDGVFAVKGTFTLRFPIHCTRFAPYIFGGAGAIFGGEHEHFTLVGVEERFFGHDDDDVSFTGQVGGGMEVRFTPHVGWINDISWNFTDHDDFGMFRSGINFAF